MPATYTVPDAAAKAAGRALALQVSQPMEGVVGSSVAEALVAGAAPVEIAQRVNRYFLVNAKRYQEVVIEGLRTEDDSAEARSWLMYGAEAGREWAESVLKAAVADGVVLADPIDELFAMEPAAIYPRFSLSAWRHEYDLTPKKAARFLEHYTLATGNWLDIEKAFGEGAPAVTAALGARFNVPDPFKQAAAALMVEDDTYQTAASMDLAEITYSLGESMNWMTLNAKQPLALAKMVWAPFVAYFILAVEKPKLLYDMNASALKPPALDDTHPHKPTSYNDVINTFITYFHPTGKHFVSPVADKQFAGIDTEVHDLILKAWQGHKLQAATVKKMLGRARRWCAQNKMAGSLFHIFNADWNKGNWKNILDNVPEDADVRKPFAEFSDEKPLPEGGIKLQQTLSDTATKEMVKTALLTLGLLSPDAPLVPVKVSDTLLGKHLAAAATPIGVYSLISDPESTTIPDEVLLGAFKATSGKTVWAFWPPKQKLNAANINVEDDGTMTGEAHTGNLVVKLAHYDMPGTHYTAPVVTPPSKAAVKDVLKQVAVELDAGLGKTPMVAPPAPAGAPVANYMIETFGEDAEKFKKVPLGDTDTGTFLAKLWGDDWQGNLPHLTLRNKKGGFRFWLCAAFVIDAKTTVDGEEVEIQDTVLISSEKENALVELNHASDDDLLAAIKAGKIEVFKGATQLWPKPVVTATPASEPAKPEGPWQPKFKKGNLVKASGEGITLIASVSVENACYYVVPWELFVLADPYAPQEAHHFPGDLFDEMHEKVSSTFASREELLGLLTGPFPICPVPTTWTPNAAGGHFTYHGKDATLMGAAFGLDNKPHPIIWVSAKTPDDALYSVPVILLDGDLTHVFAPSYNPPAAAITAEPSLEDSGPEMCGTQGAIDKAAKLGWEMTVASKWPGGTFKWPLGAVLAYQGNKMRTILGYAIQAGKPIYVMQTETGAVNFKNAPEGNAQYGPQLSTDQAVVSALKPLPGVVAAPAFPKLNYKLTDHAKELATKEGLVYVPAPVSAPFKVGSKIKIKESTQEDEIQSIAGWIDQGGVMKAAVFLVKKPTNWSPVQLKTLGDYYELVYAYGTKVDPEMEDVVFGKGTSDFMPSFSPSPSVNIPCALPEGWDSPLAVSQPPFPALDGASAVSAGIIAIIPPGSPFSSSDSVFGLQNPGILMRYPLNEFAGYKLTFPKGTVEKGESLVAAAVREVWEETGLSMKPVAFLGDFKGKTTMTRFYVGVITGGDPKKAGNETDAVTVKALANWDKNQSMSWSEYAGQLPWWKLLLERDKEVMESLVKWLNTNGIPGEHASTAAAEFDAAPASQADVTKAVTFNASLATKVDAAYPGQLPSTVDYPVSEELPSAAFSYAAGGGANGVTAWALESAAPFLNKGYPPPGVMAKRGKSDGTLTPPFTVRGYVSTAGGTHPDHLFMLIQFVELSKWGAFPIDGTAKGAELFFPVVQADAPPVTVTADHANEEFWDQFFKKMPFPLSTAAVNVLRRETNRKDLISLKSFSGMKSFQGGPVYGQGFNAGTTSYLAMGHIELVDAADKSWYFQMAVDAEGAFHALDGRPSALAAMKPNAEFTAEYTLPDPWFTHPDPVVNAKIKQVYVNGGNLEALGVTIKLFKEKWLKESNVPYYAVASYTILQDIASLFVAGAAPKPVYDSVLACLKKRMQLTQKGKKTNNTVSLLPTANKASMAVASWNGELVAALMDNPDEDAWSKPGKGFSGGSKPNFIVSNAAGTKFVWKPTPPGEAPFRPHTDRAAYRIMQLVKGNNVPVGLLKIDDVLGSVQPVVVDSTVLQPTDYDAFTDEDKIEVLAQHAADMFVGNHDGHFGNWLRTKSGIVSIDHGQAFKFFLQGVQESLDPNWTAPGNFGIHIAKKLLIDWSNGKVSIPPAGFAAMLAVADKVAKLSPVSISQIVTGLGLGAKYSLEQISKIKAGLFKRQVNYVGAWFHVLSGLAAKRGESFVWPGAGTSGKSVTLAPAVQPPVAPPVPVVVIPSKPKVVPASLTGAAKELGFTEREIGHIADANKAGYQGKAIQIDKDAFENQEVMVKRVKYSSADSSEQFATLIHFRIARHAGIKAAKKLMLKAKVVAPSSGGPAPLAIDNFWEAIIAGIKTVNEHMGPNKKKDGTPNAGTIAKVQSIKPLVEAIKQATSDPKGKYEGVSNTAANQMASNYLTYINTIVHAAAQAPKVFDAEIETIYQFLWQEPKTKEIEDEDANADIKVTKTVKAGFWPTAQAAGGDVVVKGQDSPFYAPGGSGSYQHSQFCITIPSIPGARVYWNPVEAEKGYSEVRTHFGQGWGLIPGEPSEAKVATLLKAFQHATGLDTAVPSNDDEEILYLAKQAYLLQGEVTPTSDGVGMKDPTVKKALDDYAAGTAAPGVLSTLRTHVAGKLGVTPAKMVAMPGYNVAPTYTRGNGFYRHLRLGWTRESLEKFLGAGVFLAHHTTQEGVLGFLQKVVPKNGALLANAVRAYYGVPLSGASLSADFPVGGSSNIFCAMRKAPSWQDNHLYFDVSVFLRSDVYVVGSGDSFGNDQVARYLTPESWKQHSLNKATGGVSTGSSWQFCARHDLDLRQYLHTAVLPTESDRKAAIDLCKSHGWTTFANGRKVEDVMITT